MNGYLLGIWFWIFALIAMAFFFGARYHRRVMADEIRIREWADFEDYKILQLRPFRGFEFVQLGTSTTQTAYRVRVLIPDGEEWECWVIIGGVYNVFSRQLAVRWDAAPSLRSKP